MSTTIDSLQIEITQDSQQAVNGLDALTATLGRLKAASRGGVGLTAVTNQLKKLNEAVNTMQNPSTKISQLVSALKPLESIGKSNLNSTINSLKKLPEITKQLAAIDMGAFATQINRVVIALKPLADEMNKVAAGFSAFPSRIQRLINQNEKLSASNAKTGKSFGVMGTGISSLQAKFGIYYLAYRKLSSVISEWVTESNAYVENFNLFTVAMGQYADEAISYAKKVQDAMGIDMSEWIRNQGIFMQIATGFGVVEDKAYQMSKGLTQVAYDISSFFNIQIADALTKVQSGISGELEPLRRLGYALDAATLQQIAYNHGITQNINTMTQAQKSQLRYIAIMQQSKNVMGDMSRTLITPANALRILNQQVVQLKRALGDMIIPLLIKIIPYVQAFVKVITNAARAIADLFGFELPKIDYSGLEGLSSGAEAAENAIEDTTDAVKKLKSMTTGFDELNVISQDDGSSSGAGAGGAGKYDLGVEIKAYEGFLSEMQSEVNKIAEKIQKPFENALKLAGLIGVAIASWKVSNTLFSLFTGKGGSEFFNAVNALGKSFISTSGKTIKLASILGNSTAYVSTAAVIAGIAATIAVIALRFVDLYKNSEDFRKGLSVLWDGLKTAVSWIGEQFSKLSSFIGVTDEVTRGLLLDLGAVALLFTPAAPFAAAYLIFDAIAWSIKGIGWLASDAVEEIDIFGEGISETTKSKVQPFVEQMRALDDVITTLDWTNMVIDQSVVDDVAMKVKAISETIINELDADKNEALATLAPLKKALGEEAYNQLIADNTAYYDEMISKVTQNEARINEIMAKAKAENRALTQSEADEINRIQDEMMNTGVSHLSETEIEYQTIMNRLKDNSVRISLEQASGIIKNAQLTRDEAIAAAETQYAKVELEAQRMLAVGAINDEQYNAIIDAAAQTRDETIASANEQYDTIYNTTTTKLGDAAKYIDATTGDIKSKWDVFCDNTAAWWDTTWTDIQNRFTEWGQEIKTGWNSFKNTFKTGWCAFWNSIGNFFIDIWNGIVGGFESAINWVINGINGLINTYNSVASKIPGIGSKITISNIRTVSFDRVPRLYVPQFASGGFPNVGELFIAREAGAEMVGSIGRRTAVANNDQIVEAVSQGVARAVASVSGTGEPVIENYIYFGDDKIYQSVQRAKRAADRRYQTTATIV